LRQSLAGIEGNAASEIKMNTHPLQDHIVEFDRRFWRCRGLLRLIARQILGEERAANQAVHRCWLVASRKRPAFAREGAFRSWLLRIVIEEALLLRRSGAYPAEEASLLLEAEA